MPSQSELLEKEQKLKRQEMALSSRENQLAHQEERFKNHQDKVAEKERSNQFKVQELIQREKKLQDEKKILDADRSALKEAEGKLQQTQKRRGLFMISILLISCVIAGYLANEQMSVQEMQYQQLNTATRNIDKLTVALNSVQSEMQLTDAELQEKAGELRSRLEELNQTKSMLDAVQSTSEQLQSEITQLRSDQTTTVQERQALEDSSAKLQTQFEELKARLEDRYLTNDINEVYIEYQERDIAAFRSILSQQKEQLEEQTAQLTELLATLNAHEQDLLEKEKALETITSRQRSTTEELSELKKDYLTARMINEKLENENESLKEALSAAESKLKEQQSLIESTVSQSESIETESGTVVAQQ